jgi:integrase
MHKIAWTYKRQGVPGYWVGWYDETGQRRAKSFPNKTLAKRFAATKEDQLTAGVSGEIVALDWPELLADYEASKATADGLRESSIKEIMLTLRHFERLIGPVKSTQFTQQLLERFIKTRMDDPPVRGKRKREPNGKQLSPSTLNKDIRNIKTFLRWCAGRRYLSPSVIFTLKPRRVQQNDAATLTPGQIAALLDAAAVESPAWYLRVLLAVSTGLRRGDVEALRIGDIHFDSGVISGQARKTGKTDNLPLPEKTMAVLTRYVQNCVTEGQERLFAGNTYSWFTWKRVRERAGLPKLKFHALRSVYALILVGGGFSTAVIQRMLQHSKASTTQGYINAQPLMPATAECINDALPG